MTDNSATAKSPRLQNSAINLLIQLLLLAVPLALFFLQAASSLYVSDDTYITFRYAKNLVQYGVLTWNPGTEMVDGYTSTLHTLFLAAIHALGPHLLNIHSAANILFAIATFAVVQFVLRRRFGLGYRLTFAAMVLLALSVPLQWYVTAGFEVLMFTFLFSVFIAVLLSQNDSGPKAALIAALAVLLALTRPEGALISLAAYTLWGASTALNDKKLPPRYWTSLLTFLIVIAATVAIKTAVYGHPLPNTYYAKLTTTRLGKILNGFDYFRIFFLYTGGILILGLVPLAWQWKRLPKHTPIIALLLMTFIASAIVAGGDSHGYSRFFVPVIPWLIALNVVIFCRGGAAAKSITALALANYAFTSMFTAGTYRLFSSPPTIEFSLADRIATGVQHLATSQWPVKYRESLAIKDWKYLREIFPPDTVFAHEDVGFAGFYLDRTLIDLYGLNDKEIAHRDVTHNRRNVWGKHSIDLVVARKPEVWFIPKVGPVETPPTTDVFQWPRGHNIWNFVKDPHFFLEYRIVNLPMPHGRYWPIFLRNDVAIPASAAPSSPAADATAPTPTNTSTSAATSALIRITGDQFINDSFTSASLVAPTVLSLKHFGGVEAQFTLHSPATTMTMHLGVRGDGSAFPIVGVKIADLTNGNTVREIFKHQPIKTTGQLHVPVDLPPGRYEIRLAFPSATDRSKRPPLDIHFVEFH